MINFFKKNRDSIIRGLFLIPIILVGLISISHLVSWYSLTNPLSWALYLSISIEVAAMVSLAAASVRIKGGVWFVFIIVTLIQFIGNIFYSYKEIDETSKDYKSWVELTEPLYETIGMDVNQYTHKRTLAILTGGLLPLISLASLHFFIKYEKSKNSEEEENVKKNELVDKEIIDEKTIVHEKENSETIVENKDNETNTTEKIEENNVINQNKITPTPIRTQKLTDSDYHNIIENKKDRKFSVDVVEPNRKSAKTMSIMNKAKRN